MHKTTEQRIYEAINELAPHCGDNEVYHIEFDRIMFDRLLEIDTEFANALLTHKENNDVSFWYA